MIMIRLHLFQLHQADQMLNPEDSHDALRAEDQAWCLVMQAVPSGLSPSLR